MTSELGGVFAEWINYMIKTNQCYREVEQLKESLDDVYIDLIEFEKEVYIILK